MKKESLVVMLLILISFSFISKSFQEKIKNKLQKVEICRSCKQILSDLRKEKNSIICDKPNYDKITCYELYYYLFYFQPDYFFSEKTESDKDCEICSKIDRCYYYECTENKNIFQTEILNLTNNKNEIDILNLTNNKKNEILINNNNVLLEKNMKVFKEKTNNNMIKSADQLLKINKSNKSAKNLMKKTYFTTKFEKNAISYLRLLQNKLSVLSDNINEFMKINSNTNKFKQNLVKTYIYIKIKNNLKNSKRKGDLIEESSMFFKKIESELTKNQTKVLNPINFSNEIKIFQQKINNLFKKFKLIKSQKDILDHVKTISATTKESELLIKEAYKLTSRIHSDNIINLNNFKDILAVVDKKIEESTKIQEMIEKNLNNTALNQTIHKPSNSDSLINLLQSEIKILEKNQAKLIDVLNPNVLHNLEAKKKQLIKQVSSKEKFQKYKNEVKSVMKDFGEGELEEDLSIERYNNGDKNHEEKSQLDDILERKDKTKVKIVLVKHHKNKNHDYESKEKNREEKKTHSKKEKINRENEDFKSRYHENYGYRHHRHHKHYRYHKHHHKY